jgi:NitT/TauT family transport system permease protein
MSQETLDDVVPKPTTVRRGKTVMQRIEPALWIVASLSMFVGLWEIAWWRGWANPLLLPPPHIFLANLPDQFRFFVLGVIGWSSLRVLGGLVLGFSLSVLVGLGIRYFYVFGKLMLPIVTMLAPISPVAWIPVAVFVFGIGNPPAIFLVFIAIFFIMTLATLSQIDNVPKNYIQLAMIMGCSKRQIYRHVILPTILPDLFVTLRMNLFAAWMVVLIAEAVGVGSGLGQVTMMARNTFNSSLVFFTMTLIGITGFAFDQALRYVQRKVLWWVGPSTVGGL